jgi:hypothetical protein
VVVAVIGVAPVADNVHSTDHLADSEETNNLGGGNASESKLLLVGIANPGNDVLGREVLEVGGVASSVNQRLEVSLEGSQVANIEVSGLRVRVVSCTVLNVLTEESCSGHGIPA